MGEKTVRGYMYTCPDCGHEGEGEGKMPKKCPECRGKLW